MKQVNSADSLHYLNNSKYAVVKEQSVSRWEPPN